MIYDEGHIQNKIHPDSGIVSSVHYNSHAHKCPLHMFWHARDCSDSVVTDKGQKGTQALLSEMNVLESCRSLPECR